MFSRPVIVTYKGPEAAQQFQVHVVSYAYKMRNGILLGECTLLLDDLVHARTARVLKLPLLSPNHNRSNGSLMVSGTRYDPSEAGTWVQLHLSSNFLPWINAEGEMTSDANKGTMPNAFFEIWQQSVEGEKQVYKSEVTNGSNDPEWWPLALNGRKLGASADAFVWVRFWNQRLSNDDSFETVPPDYMGECRLNLRELVTGRRVPILAKWRGAESVKLRSMPVMKGGVPQVHVKDCKWIKLAQNAKLECQPVYKQDMNFLKDLMDHVDLDASTKESCLSCLHFVTARAKFWAMNRIVSESVKIVTPAVPKPSSQDVIGFASPRAQKSASATGEGVIHDASARRSSMRISLQTPHLEGHGGSASSLAVHAQDFETAHNLLQEHTPMSRRRKSFLWRVDLDAINERCKSRSESISSIRSPREDAHAFGGRSLLSSSQTFDAAPGAAPESGHIVPPLRMHALQLGADGETLAAKRSTYRPQSAHAPAAEQVYEQKQRPSTAREPHPRPTWRPFSAKSRLPRARTSRPVSARSQGASSEGASEFSRAATPAQATSLFRESIRPLLANVMRQGTETQHPCSVKPVSACSLTPEGKFRFRNSMH